MVKDILRLSILCILVMGVYGCDLAKNKFEKEVDKEKAAVKLLREVHSGGYGIVTAEELKKLIDSGKDILIIDTMPYENSYKKMHVPGAKNFLFPIPIMETWDT
ncbi:MAG: rhodanese-like domain-containing protein, partial [Desulfobacteraceae bacterium]